MSMKKVVVVGLLPGQIRRVERQVKGAKLRFVEGGGHQKVKVIPGGDFCLMMARFISHETQNRVVSVFGRGGCAAVHGGPTDLVRAINQYLQGK